ncbi:MAG: vanadium-dependent haloperoxidase [Acidobacteriota bacterium]
MKEHGETEAACQSADPATDGQKPESNKSEVSRRNFLRGVGGTGVLAASGLAGGVATLATPGEVAAEEIGPERSRRRAIRAFQVRNRAARNASGIRLPEQECNGDDALYADRRASFFKTLPQDNLGEVDTGAYNTYLQALETGDSATFESIPLSTQADRRLANPQASYAYEMTGLDGHASRMPAAPAFTSPLQSVEMGEVYWQALTRDVPFSEYGSDALVGAALADLNGFSSSLGPTEGGQITANTLFRGETPGDLIGPYISQLMWLDVPYGPTTIEQRYGRPLVGDDFMVDYSEWLAIQRGAAPVVGLTFDPTPRYISNNRGLGEWVHGDVSFQGYFNAALIMLGLGSGALCPRNPYLASANQGGFVTFGGPQVVDLVTKAADSGLKAAWYQKWLVHRRLRPELFAARIENQRNGSKDYGLSAENLNSDAVSRLLTANGNTLLPMAFAEGSPTHPSYPAGHAVIAGACCTILKAFFNESFVFPSPVVASTDGSALDAWTGADLTLGNEINKLAANISIGRDAAGVHYRSDGVDGIICGEQVAISMLQDYSIAFTEVADGFELTRFDGQRILISQGEVSAL